MVCMSSQLAAAIPAAVVLHRPTRGASSPAPFRRSRPTRGDATASRQRSGEGCSCSTSSSSSGPHASRARRSDAFQCRSSADQSGDMQVPEAPPSSERVATEGDVVYIHFDCKDEEGNVMETTRGEGDVPISFEVGAGDLFANEMIKGFDVAVRGLAVGQKATIEATGNPWQKELVFEVPREHPEMQRLEGRYRNVGGLAKDLVVELANGGRAVVLELTDSMVRLDANSFVAGRRINFEIELLRIEDSE